MSRAASSRLADSVLLEIVPSGNFRTLKLAFLSRIVGETENAMKLFNKIFTTRTLVQIIFVLSAAVVMKGLSAPLWFQRGNSVGRRIENSALDAVRYHTIAIR
jgi:hypothetical protein